MQEEETPLYETSEMLAIFLASTPLVSEAWRLCNLANTGAPRSFVFDQIGEVGYIAFSGIQTVTIGSNLVPIDTNTNGLFSSFRSSDDGEVPPAMVHAGFLQLFLSIYSCPDFQNQMVAIMGKCKALIITGHSIGGTIASLTTLWLLSYLQSQSSSFSILCITFGSLLFGNESLSKAILRERWVGKFCNIVAKDDIVPRVLFAPLPAIAPQLKRLLQLWHLLMTSLQFIHLATQLSDEEKAGFYQFVSTYVANAVISKEESVRSLYVPVGSYLFYSSSGAICVDNTRAIVWMLHLLFLTASANSCIEDHLKYGDLVDGVSQLFLKRRCVTPHVLSDSNYEVGISLALEASGILGQESVSGPARECLKMAGQMGRAPNLNSAKLAIGLAKVSPYRAQIEWYKASCDNSNDQMGYYDSFKLRGASKRDSKINLNRFKLAEFWNNVMHMLETNQLPYDFHKRSKWVYASHSYKLLVEPLDIAEYYRIDMHKLKGHYRVHGRERRYEIFERWWKDGGYVNQDSNKRTKFASLTQDSCFWARVEEAREWVESARVEKEIFKLVQIRDNLQKFEMYVRGLVENREVSCDVFAKKSSYSLWVDEWKELKSQMLNISL